MLDKLSPRLQKLKEAGLLGCLDGTGITSQNYKGYLNMEWISCDDRFPEEGEVVLIYRKGCPITGAYLMYERGSPDRWWICDWGENDYFLRWNEATHWMPSPKLPED